MKNLLFLDCIFLCLLSFSLAFAAPEKTKEEMLQNVSKQLRCPTCKGLSVADSEAGFALDIKNKIKDQLDKGLSEEEILEYFRSRYGVWILREPPKEGVGLLAWLIPVLLLVLGPVVVWLTVWRRPVEVDGGSVRDRDVIVREFMERVRQ